MAPRIEVGRKLGRWWAAAVCTALACGSIHAIAGADFGKRSFAAAVGVESKEAYLGRVLTTYHDAVRRVNELVPAHARVLVIGDKRGYGFLPLALNRDFEDTPALFELVRESSGPGRIGARLRQTGAEYVLLNFVTAEYLGTYLRTEFVWRTADIALWWEYWRRHAVEIWRSPTVDHENGGFCLYRLSWNPHVPADHMPFLPGTEGMLAWASGTGGQKSGDVSITPLFAAMRAAPGVDHFANLAGYAFRTVRRSAEAYRWYADPARRDVVDDENWFGLGLVLLDLGRLKESEHALQYAWDLYPERRLLIDQVLATLEYKQGEAQLDEGQWIRASESFRRCVEALERIKDTTPGVVDNMALALLRSSLALTRAGHLEEASTNYDRALRMLPRAIVTTEARDALRALSTAQKRK